MTGPNMATITASLERSLQNCSLNHHNHNSSSSSSNSIAGVGRSAASDSPENHHGDLSNNSSDTALELNSQISLPYHWEQCLDLKTGEIYYINWRTGIKAKEDPRTRGESSGDIYSDDDDRSSYDSEGSSSESSLLSSREPHNFQERNGHKDHILVVAGCKSCLMYFMLPKQVEDCPKCCGQLLHFDRSFDNTSSP
ncbi:unnamed protein product [Ilex paraguariensis]|uniref:WW domain-containing protein n=1 Tax=Ilex paraguariensis TaxID=185542 RepID=A0ABC8SIQ2_9AQUA